MTPQDTTATCEAISETNPKCDHRHCVVRVASHHEPRCELYERDDELVQSDPRGTR